MARVGETAEDGLRGGGRGREGGRGGRRGVYFCLEDMRRGGMSIYISLFCGCFDRNRGALRVLLHMLAWLAAAGAIRRSGSTLVEGTAPKLQNCMNA